MMRAGFFLVVAACGGAPPSTMGPSTPAPPPAVEVAPSTTTAPIPAPVVRSRGREIASIPGRWFSYVAFLPR